MNNNRDELQTENNMNNDFNILLGLGIIVSIWLIWFVITRLINNFFNWDYYWLRVIIIYPFTMVTIKLSSLIWKRFV